MASEKDKALTYERRTSKKNGVARMFFAVISYCCRHFIK